MFVHFKDKSEGDLEDGAFAEAAIADRLDFWRVLADWPHDVGPGMFQDTRASLKSHFGVGIDDLGI